MKTKKNKKYKTNLPERQKDDKLNRQEFGKWLVLLDVEFAYLVKLNQRVHGYLCWY
jgi:hypothetical protein